MERKLGIDWEHSDESDEYERKSLQTNQAHEDYHFVNHNDDDIDMLRRDTVVEEKMAR